MDSYIKYILQDNLSLRTYYKQCKRVCLADVKRSVLLMARSYKYSVPDHYYRLGLDASFEGIENLCDLFTVGLPKLAEEYLEQRDGCVYVKGDKVNGWQMVIPYIPPLLLIVTKLGARKCVDIGSVLNFARDNIEPSVRFTAIPSAWLPEMEALKKENCGFSDLHIHLNGTTEVDVLWQDFISNPEPIYYQVQKAYHNSKVREQVQQMTEISNPTEFLDLLHIAGRIREWLYNRVAYDESILESCSFESLLSELVSSKEVFKENPLKYVLGENASPLILEGAFYAIILSHLNLHPQDEAVAGLFHYYLLILGLCNRLVVQQADSFGFDQFQKYTANNFREYSEKSYERRFFQLAGNGLDNFRHIEGRFALKKTLEENLDIIGRIKHGFESLNRCQESQGVKCSSLSLVGHFIKRPDAQDGKVRFEELRREIKVKTEALSVLMNTRSKSAMMVTGVDAAASEFDTPPEVFAPAYRRLRECGIKHFTFHAGEDFFHILSGIRAIYEAMYFLDLEAGDRIGHASALGVDVELWADNVGPRVWMKIGDRLDDLIFSYYLISTSRVGPLEHLLPLIALEALRLASKIYPFPCNIYDLIEAWKMRVKDPTEFAISDGERTSDRLFHYYHSRKGRNETEKIEQVGVYDIFAAEDLRLLQQELLRLMYNRQIVIETLPTSNVMIGHHKNFKSYHLYNWYRWSKEGIKVPPIVVGTDDAGIFATNIYNEYCHIYCLLVFEKGVSPYEAMSYIRSLDHNAEVYAFGRYF